MDAVHDKLDEVVRAVEQARTVPMSSSVMVHRGEVLELLSDLRTLLPQELQRASGVLDDREALVDDGRREAARVIEEAERLRDRLIAQEEVHRRAVEQAARLLDEAAERAAAMRVEVDDYVDGRLATFEIVLHRTLAAVERGRTKIAGRSGLDELTGPDEPLPH